MRKTFFSLFFLACIYANGHAQKDTSKVYQNQLKFSISHFLDNALFFDYERSLKNGNSLLFGAGPVYTETNNTSKTGFYSEIQYKLYITSKETKDSWKRIYVAPYLGYKYLETQSGYSYWLGNNYVNVLSKNYFHSFCPGIIAGFNIVSYHRLIIDFYIGGGMKRTFDGDFIGKVDYENNNLFEPGYNGVIPRAGFEMGITF